MQHTALFHITKCIKPSASLFAQLLGSYIAGGLRMFSSSSILSQYLPAIKMGAEPYCLRCSLIKSLIRTKFLYFIGFSPKISFADSFNSRTHRELAFGVGRNPVPPGTALYIHRGQVRLPHQKCFWISPSTHAPPEQRPHPELPGHGLIIPGMAEVIRAQLPVDVLFYTRFIPCSIRIRPVLLFESFGNIV